MSGVLKNSLLASAVFAVSAVGAYANDYPSKTVEGYRVNVCQYANEFDDSVDKFDFCSKKSINTYKKYSAKDINFNKKYVLIALEKYYYVALNPKTKEVFTVPFSIGEHDSNQAPKLNFSKTSNKVCATNTGFNELDTFLFRGGDAMKNTRYCVSFMEAKIFKDMGFGMLEVYNAKTGKLINNL